MAMLFAVASDSQNLKKVVDSNSKLANLGEWGQDLIEKEGGIHSAVAAKLVDDEAELKMPATPSHNTKTPTNRLASPRLIYDHYSKKYRFTRNETCAESEEWPKQLDDSLPPAPTAETLAAAAVPPAGTAPDLRMNQLRVPKNPPEELNNIAFHKIEKACETLHRHCNHIFNICIVVFKRQCSTNKIIENISASEKELEKNESAEETSAVSWKSKSLPEERVVDELLRDAAQKAAKDGLRKTNNNVDTLQAEVTSLKKELKKLRRENKRQRTELESSDPKEAGGREDGAHKRNQSNATSTTTTQQSQMALQPPPSEESPKKKQQKNKKKKGVQTNERKQKQRETPHGGNQRGGRDVAPPMITQESSLAEHVQDEHAGRRGGRSRGLFTNRSWTRGRDSELGTGRGRA
eukprot:scaffold248379_cov34-Cyclotella_meneghiniana.AAC.2